MTTVERVPLSRERVAAAALVVGDEEGLDALSMRKVGAHLNVEAMSLYNHVANKDDLLDAVGDMLYGEVLERHEVDTTKPWKHNARYLVQTFHDVAMEHPSIVSIMLDRPIPSMTKVLFLQRCFDVFLAAGYPTREATLAFNTVSSWMTGFVRSELTLMKRLHENGPSFTREDVPEEFHGAIDFMESCIASTPAQRLEAGLDVLFAGFEKGLSDNGWA